MTPIIGLAWIILLALTAGEAVAKEDYGGKLAILPLENSSGRLRALHLTDSCLAAYLADHGFSLLPDSQLRPILRAHRIRSVGSIGRDGAELLWHEAGVRYLLLGSIDVFEEGALPEAALSLRILDATTLRIVWAGSDAGSGQDGTWLFGMGKTADIGILLDRIVVRMLAPLADCFPDRCVIGTTGYTAAIIPLENYSDDVHASDIASNVLLTRLVALGIGVVEPGLVEDVLVRRQVMPRGEIDLDTWKAINRECRADFLVTGAVDQFQPGRGDVLTADPLLELSLRFLRPGGSVRAIRAGQTAGDRGESFFGLGREYSMGRLLRGQLDRLLDFPALATLARPEEK